MDVTRAAGAANVDHAALAEAASGASPHVFPDGLVCNLDSPLIELRRTCVRVAASPATVLLTGETGTGKEVFARLIHAHSPRAKRQFVPVNCGAIPEALLESELFGYVKGAFTGANTPRRGRVALAEGGTLFLDEIGELPLSLQVKLLRLLQQKTYEPVGSSESVSADFRLIAATNRDLLAEVRAGRFRQDLFYRLNVCPVHLPPLRVRRPDVVALFLHFWRTRGETRPVEPGVLRRLSAYDWPGNVRELENLVERLSVIAEGAVIREADLPVPLGDPDVNGAGMQAALAELVSFPGLPSAVSSAVSGVIAATPVTPPPAAPVSVVMPAAPVAVPAPPVVMPAAPVAAVTAAPAPGSMPAAAPPTFPAVAPLLPVSVPFTAAPAAADLLAVPPPAAPAAFIVDDNEVSGVHTFPASVPAETRDPAAVIAANGSVQALPVNLPVLLRELEEAYIAKALAQSGGNKKEAARLLGMGRTTLVEKLRRRNADTSAS
jgi:sigma-54 specific flagellar transcriptional regulator A